MVTNSLELTHSQIDQFHHDGFLLLENVVSAKQLSALLNDFESWKEESRNHEGAWGLTLDQRPRFDVEPGHSAQRPTLRRIASPIEISEAYLELMRNSKALDAATQLIGPNLRFNNSKINSKQPGSATQVRLHQDFMFEPHSNDDLITILYFLDDVTLENGPLEVIPGSHKGPLYEHWQDNVFTGSVSDAVVAEMLPLAIPCYGKAGSACLMHTRLLHGSAPNKSQAPRTLFICEYTAEDAIPLQENHIPSRYMGEVVRGVETGQVRCSSYEMRFPEVPTGASFFEQQAKRVSKTS